MEMQVRTLTELFDQLGLESDPASIEQFIAEHPLEPDQKVSEASFWSAAQASLLKEGLRSDDDLAPIIDELNARLHPNEHQGN